MEPNDEAVRKLEQGRALDVFKPQQGAFIEFQYLKRKQEYLAVNKSDLENIRDFDSVGYALNLAGSFFFGGGSWLGIETYLTMTSQVYPPLLIICVCSAVLGAILFLLSRFFMTKKRSIITKIFEETSPILAPKS